MHNHNPYCILTRTLIMDMALMLTLGLGGTLTLIFGMAIPLARTLALTPAITLALPLATALAITLALMLGGEDSDRGEEGSVLGPRGRLVQ